MKMLRLGDLAELRSGSTPLRGEAGFYGGSVPWAKIEDLTRAGMWLTKTVELVTDIGVRAARLRVFPVGTVLIAMYGSIGTVSIAGIRTTTNQAILGIECGPDLDPEYLWFYLKSKHRVLTALGRGGTQANINASILRDMLLPVPALTEQRLLARSLSVQIRLAQAARGAVAEQRDAHNSLIRACLARRMSTSSDDGWPEARLGDVVEIQLGKMLSPASKVGTRPVPYLRIANVQWDRFALADVYEMDFTEDEERKFQLRPGDILVCEGGEPGRAAIWEGEIVRCCYQKALHRLRPLADAVDPRFLLYRLWLGSLRSEFAEDQAATTIAHLPAVRLAELVVRLPNLVTQVRVATELREELSSIEVMGRSFLAQQDAIDRLSTALLHRAFQAA